MAYCVSRVDAQVFNRQEINSITKLEHDYNGVPG